MPTVSTEAVFVTGAIESHEGRIVACFDIPGAYLRADCSGKGEKFMLLEGQLAELMVLVEPKLYRTYVTYFSLGGSNALRKDAEGPVWHAGISFSFLQASQKEVGG